MLPLVSTRRRHVDGPRTLELPGQQLAPDGVAHVVAQERELVDADGIGERDDDVGLLGEGVRLVGLVGQPVPEQVEQQDPPVPAQVVEHVAEVERRAREPVQHEQRRLELRLARLGHDREHRMAGEPTVLAACGPLGDAQDRGPRTSAPGRASTMMPSRTATSAVRGAPPVPSTTVPPRITRSCTGYSSYLTLRLRAEVPA